MSEGYAYLLAAVIAGVAILALPFAVFAAIKLGTYAWYAGREAFYERYFNKEKDDHGP